MRKTKFKILSILILTSLLAFIGCNDDDLHSHNHEAKAGIKSSKITFNEFKKYTKAFNLVADVNKKQNESNATLNKIVKDTVNNFTIDTQEGLYLQYANLHSFTFPIRREVDNGKLENLVLSYQNNGSYKVKILQYDLTAQEKIDLELDQLKTIQNPIVTIPIENFDTNLVVNGCETVTELVVIPCSEGVHNSGNLEDWWRCTATTPGRVYAVSRIECIDAGDSVGGGDPNNGGLGWEPVGGGDSNYPPEYPTSQTDPEDYEEGISAPTKFLDKPEKTPCEELNRLTNIAATKNALSGLSSKVNLNNEFGFSISTNNTGSYSAPVECNSNALNANQINMPVGGNIIGAFHTHPLASTSEIFPMFTDGDINWLFWVAYSNSTPRDEKVYEEFFLTLTVPQGTFALKIKDWRKFSAFRWSGEWSNGSQGVLHALNKKYDKIEWSGNFIRMQNALLEIFKEFDAGVGLYEANSELTGWSELELAPGGNSYNLIEPTKKPCQ